MKNIVSQALTVLVCLLLMAQVHGQDDEAQPRPSGTPSVFQHGFSISYPDSAIRIGDLVVQARADGTSGAEMDAGLYLLLLNEAGQPGEVIFSRDFTELLRTLPDHMVIGLSIQGPDSEFGDQYFYGRLKADLTGLSIGEFTGDVIMAPANLEFPPRSDALPAADQSQFRMKRVAHAGGGLDGVTYSNSFEALDSNLSRGFAYFEIDFVFTSDDHLVCLHDWDVHFEKTFGFKSTQRYSLQGFLELVAANDRFTNCTLEGLADWMIANPAAYLVTDVKDDNLSALGQIVKTIPDARRRVIPQIYFPQEYDAVKEMGFEQVIWTLYRLGISDLEVLNQVIAWDGPVAVTMPKAWADSGLAVLLNARGIPSFAHTVNSEKTLETLTRELGFAEIYTDFLNPLEFPLETSDPP